MKKTVSAIILVVLVLFLVKNCAVWKYEATVNGHNAPITVRVSMSGGRRDGCRLQCGIVNCFDEEG